MQIDPVRDDALQVRITGSEVVDGVRAGSALLALDGRLLAIADDTYTLARIAANGAVTHQVLAGTGEALPKARKPDFEAAAVAPDGSVWLIGSGSTSARYALVHLSGPGHTRHRQYDGTALYLALAEAIGGDPNIEGAVFVDDRLLLLHRSTGMAADLLLDLPAHALVSGHPPRAAVRARIAPAGLGGVPAHGTDLAATADGRLVWLAAAEETDDPVLDGPVAGVLLGVLDGDGARCAPITEADGSPSTRKAEGLVLDADLRGGWAITDRDDPDQPADLLRLEISGL
jgi:hypothetical protein